MKESIMNRADSILKAYRQHKAWVVVFLCLALVVGTVTTLKLTKSGVAMTEQVKELDCHVKIHKHTDACKDAEGNIVCGYADYIIHKHDESCYDIDGELVCGLPEVKLHEHTDACKDAEGNLICTELIALHTHTDACKDAEGHLICGQIELLEHSHGEGCFNIVEVEAGDPETEAEEAEEAAEAVEAEPADAEDAAAADEPGQAEAEPEEIAEAEEAAAAEEPAEDEEPAAPQLPGNIITFDVDLPIVTAEVFPAQSFEQEVEGVKVAVEAAEGAFPVGTIMVVKPVAAESVEAAVAGAVTDKITQIQAVDVTFVDADGNEIEPLAEIKVSITSLTIDETDTQLLMKVNEDGSVELIDQEVFTESEVVAEEAAPALEE